jgi:hypothetical protein
MNLVYYTVGSDIRYVDMLKYSIESLRTFGKYKDDILIISDDVCIRKVKQRFRDYKILHIQNPSIHCESSINKLRINSYIDIKNYNKIIFLDLDILIQNEIDIIFGYIEDKFIFSNEHFPTKEHPQKIGDIGNWHGAYLFSEEEAKIYDIKNKNAVNSGFFGFNVSLLPHFDKMLLEIDKDRSIQKNKGIIDWCCEQPTVNKYMAINNIYSDKVSEKILKFAMLYKYDDIKILDKVIIHFCWGVGRYEEKIEKMQDWFNHLKSKRG